MCFKMLTLNSKSGILSQLNASIDSIFVNPIDTKGLRMIGELQTYKVVSETGEVFFFSARTPSEAAQKAYQLCIPHRYDHYEEV